MRIIAGKYRGKKLISPKTNYTRPTLDTVKEAVFSMLGSNILEAKVLDLFSGTGNLGIEAISRGATFVWMNDYDKNATSVIYENVTLTDCAKYVKITKKEYNRCLKQIIAEGIQFDCIFLDPPYDSDCVYEVVRQIMENNILAVNGIIVVERDKGNTFDVQIEGLKLIKDKRYGRVDIKMFKLEEE